MKKLFVGIFIAACVLFVGAAAQAAKVGDPCKQDSDCEKPNTCVDAKCAAPESEPCDPDRPDQGQCIKLVNPLKDDTTDINVILGTIIRYVLGLIGSLTLLMLVWGSFQWLTSAGNPEQIKKGTDTILWAVIGVILVFSSYLILTTFTNFLVGKQ